MTNKRRTFSEQIRRLIDASGESRYRIAVECAIDHGLMSRFMAGTGGFSMQTLDALADYLGWEVVAKRKPNKKIKAKGKAEK